MNDPADDRHSRYYDAAMQAGADLEDALSHVRAEEDEHRITPAQAAAERCELLERHLELCRRLRQEILGGS